MGYAGYVPAKLPPSKLSDVEAAIRAVASLEALEIIGKLLYNIAVSPKEEKFRRVRLTNDKIKRAVVDAPGALEALMQLGWKYDEEDNEFLLAERPFTMKEVRMVEDAKDLLRKEMRSFNAQARAVA